MQTPPCTTEACRAGPARGAGILKRLAGVPALADAYAGHAISGPMDLATCR